MTLRGTPKALFGRNATLVLLGLLLLGALLIAVTLLSQLLALPSATLPPATSAVRPSLVSTLLQQPAIVLSGAISTLIMLSALLVALAPLTWWMRLVTAMQRQPDPALVQAMVWVQAHQPQPHKATADELAAIAGQPFVLTPDAISAPTLSPAAPADAAAPPASATPPAAAPPGGANAPGGQAGAAGATAAPPAGAGAPAGQPAAPGAPPVPGQPPAPGQQPAAQPPAPGQQPAAAQPPAPAQQPPQPGQPQPVSTLQQELKQEEGVNLQEITSVDDILSSAFNDDEEVDEQLLVLSQSLSEVDVHALVKHTRRIQRELRAVGVE